MVKIVQKISVALVLLAFTGSYLELPSVSGYLFHTQTSCCMGNGTCCCAAKASAAREARNTGTCMLDCAGCCHGAPVSLPSVTREYFPATLHQSNTEYSKSSFPLFLTSSYSLLLTEDFFRPPAA